MVLKRYLSHVIYCFLYFSDCCQVLEAQWYLWQKLFDNLVAKYELRQNSLSDKHFQIVDQPRRLWMPEGVEELATEDKTKKSL